MMVPACFGVARKAGRTLLLVAVFAAVSLRGGTGGSISGTVTDPKEAVVVNAQVTVINQSTNISQKVATNSSGIYSFPDLMVGTYDIQVEALGFRQSDEFDIRRAEASERDRIRFLAGEMKEYVLVGCA